MKGRIIFERLHLSAVCIGVKNDSIIYALLPFNKELGSFPPKKTEAVKEQKKSKAKQLECGG